MGKFEIKLKFIIENQTSMKKQLTIILVLAFISTCGFSQRKLIRMPELPGYVILKCDFHTHTIFSDGNVWPTNRVDEAVRDGLDALAITDHLEYTPKKDFIPVDFNAAWKITEGYAKDRNIILVHGAEITKSKMPPGHLNALFINDAAPILKDSVFDACTEAIKQGAFIMWNHPGWKAQQPDGIPRMYEIHRRLIKNKMLHGIEFFNDSDFYPPVFTFCEQNNLAIMASSDAHAVISERYGNNRRPMTLVLAKGRNSEALKEALFAGRTIAYFNETLAGKEEYVLPFFNGCISVNKPYIQNDRNVMFEITNKSDIPFYLVNGPAGAPAAITLPPNTATRVVLSRKFTGILSYEVKNIMTGENKFLKVGIPY